MTELKRIQDWYLSQCNQDWEHQYGIRIETLDNPGWTLEVDLSDTDLEGKDFTALNRGDPGDDADWIHCKVEQDKFSGSGGARNLAELMRFFLNWADK